jgi:hypothetical protein
MTVKDTLKEAKMSVGDIIETLEDVLSASKVSKKQGGSYKAMWSYFYTHGATPEKYVQKVLNKYPNAEIIDKGDNWAPFKGGAPIERQSYMWVQFKINSEDIKPINYVDSEGNVLKDLKSI